MPTLFMSKIMFECDSLKEQQPSHWIPFIRIFMKGDTYN